MRAFATLIFFSSSKSKDAVVKNLNRILEIKILDIDIEISTITFLHASKSVLERFKRELNCIGFPILSLQIQNHKK